MTLKEVLDKTTQFFKDKKLDSPRLDAELLLAHGLKLQRIQLYLKFDQPLRDEELVTCRELVRRRVQGEPVAYILGTKEFYGFSYRVNSAVLIPRPETEHIIDAALEWAKDQSGAYNILDLGSGTGCLGLTLLKKLPNAKLVSVDISADALEVAKANAESLNVLDRVQFVQADATNSELVLAAAKETFGEEAIHMVVSNPPYISPEDKDIEENVKKFEPEVALFAPDKGLKYLKDWAKNYTPALAGQAIMLMEMGMTQGPAMKSTFDNLGMFDKVDIIKDLASLDRIIRGVRNG